MAFVSAAKVLSRLTCVFDLNPFIPFVVQEKKERKGGLSKSVSLREQFFLSCEKQGTKKKIGAPKVKKKKKKGGRAGPLRSHLMTLRPPELITKPRHSTSRSLLFVFFFFVFFSLFAFLIFFSLQSLCGWFSTFSQLD